MTAAKADRPSSIVLGVTGGIAAYKAALLLRMLREAGHDVQVVPTAASEEFVGRATWEALSGHPVSSSVFDGVDEVRHVSIGAHADILVIAPATADFLARMAAGLADDLLSATALMATCPVVVAPAMHTQMWQHPATRRNIETLRERGVIVVGPEDGRLTGADSGPGRLAEPSRIADVVLRVLVTGRTRRDLGGRRIVVSAGGTREAMDPVRFLGNRSSGRQGVAIAQAARDRGAEVTLVAANLEVTPPRDVAVVDVVSAADLREAMIEASTDADVLIMAAAVADFRPAHLSDVKIKKQDGQDGMSLDLVRNPDILTELSVGRRAGQLIVGFAAETGEPDRDVLTLAREKLRRKGADLLVVNDVSGGRVFGSSENAVVILDAAGDVVAEASGTKGIVADALLDVVAAR